jgi:hypothetical protein
MGLTTKQIEAERRSTKDLLLLVGVKTTLVALRQLSGWEMEQAADWAAMAYLHASDNAVKVPPMPRCLRSFPHMGDAR